MDAIDHVLEGLKLQSSVFSRMELGEGWGFAKDCLGGAPFHIVIEGEAWVGHDAGDLVKLSAGQMVVLPRGEAHLLLSAPGSEAIPFKRISLDMGIPEWKPGLRMKPMVLRIGPKGPAVARLVSGIFEFMDRRRNPLLAALPDLLILRDMKNAGARQIRADIGRLIDHEIELGEPGARLVAGRLADYLFIEAVREHLMSHRSDDASWLHGLRDPVVGLALTLIHTRSDESWSVEALAREVGFSRSRFAERFRQRIGRGPMEYLRDWRMFTAAGRLEEGRMSLKEIAGMSGYRSVAAFGRAFKEWSGESPAASRRSATTRAETTA